MSHDMHDFDPSLSQFKNKIYRLRFPHARRPKITLAMLPSASGLQRPYLLTFFPQSRAMKHFDPSLSQFTLKIFRFRSPQPR